MQSYAGDPLNIIHTVGLETVAPVVRVELTFAQALDKPKFEQALHAVVGVVPELGCRYVLATNSYTPIDAPLIHDAVANPDADARNWRLTEAPQLRVYWQSDQHLVIYISHVFADGAGAKELLYLIAQAYRDGGAALAGKTNSTDAAWLQAQVAKHQIQAAGADHPAKPLSLPALADDAKKTYRVGHLTLSATTTQALIHAAKALGVTVNDVVMAAFGRSVQRFSDTSRIALACPTDMRQFAPDDQRRIANFTSRYNFDIDAPDAEPFAAIVQRVHEAMVKNKQTRQCFDSIQDLLAQVHTAPLAELQQTVAANYHMRDIAYTNFGVLAQDQLDFGVALNQVIMTGGFRTAPAYQTAVATYAGRLTLAFNMIGNETDYRFGIALLHLQELLIENFALEMRAID